MYAAREQVPTAMTSGVAKSTVHPSLVIVMGQRTTSLQPQPSDVGLAAISGGEIVVANPKT